MVDMDLIPEERKWEIYKMVVNNILQNQFTPLESAPEMVEEIITIYYNDKK